MPVSVQDISEPKSNTRKLNSSQTWTIVTVVVAILLSVAVRLQVEHRSPQRDEVERVTSPDGSANAVLYELSDDASNSFNYQVAILWHGKAQQVVDLVGAKRNDRAYGVNLRWQGEDNLSVEYLEAQRQDLLASSVSVGSHEVRVSLRSGVRDEDAPPGGMLINLKETREPRL